MKFLILCASVVLGKLLSDADFWKDIEGAEFITELDNKTHLPFTTHNLNEFVMYYATWCGFCQQCRSGFAGAAKTLNANVSFGAVDCDKAKSPCETRVTGYPTFFFYKNGTLTGQYEGDRTTSDFVTYLQQYIKT